MLLKSSFDSGRDSPANAYPRMANVLALGAEDDVEDEDYGDWDAGAKEILVGASPAGSDSDEER